MGAQSRKWYFEKRDWIVCDEIEDEDHEDADEEEEEIVIPVLPVGDTKVVGNCPVCTEEFDQFYKQGDNDEEGGWYVHNAVPEETEIKTEAVVENVEMEDSSSITEAVDNGKEVPVKVEESECILELVEPMENIEMKEELEKEGKATDNNDNNVEVKDGVAVKEEDAEETAKEDDTVKETEEVSSANNSLVADGAENHLSAPVIGPQKVDIKMSFTSRPEPLERRESVMSSKSESEESEFDVEAIIVPSPSEEEKHEQKPRLKGKKFIVMPARQLDTDLSGLCSIM